MWEKWLFKKLKEIYPENLGGCVFAQVESEGNPWE